MEKKTWLDALYNHPLRDEIIRDYILSYWSDKDLQIKSVQKTVKEKENVIEVKYLTKYFETPFRYIEESDKPIEVVLNIGEYFKYERSANVVTLKDQKVKKLKFIANRKFIIRNDEMPVYIFNEQSSLSGGKNTQFLIGLLEELNAGVRIDNETFQDMLIRKTTPIMQKMIRENRDKKEHYITWYQNYFHWKYPPLMKIFKNKKIFDYTPPLK